jgi:transcriptional regulator with XRE-family HTH domain
LQSIYFIYIVACCAVYIASSIFYNEEKRGEPLMDREIDYVAMGERIRRARENERLTQEQLAENCSLSTAHMGHIERGTRTPSLESVFRISKSLHVSMDYLLTNSLTPDDTLLSNVNALLKNSGKLKPKTLASTIRAIADKMDEV